LSAAAALTRSLPIRIPGRLPRLSFLPIFVIVRQKLASPIKGEAIVLVPV
jgi:hypothetical protein